ncbi:MAG TPA: acyltransferase [Dongiaceae bacterium]|nr:acyltransferase [Dongiaceae bacterium]
MTQRRETLLPLTSLRFVAALLVFSWHCVPTRRIAVTFSFGYLGVAFFFLLSGFILTYTYHGAFRDGLRVDAIRAFYAARIARVYPLHLAAMPLAIACLALGTSPLWNAADAHTRLDAIAAQAVLLQSWIPVGPVYFGANGPAWSISVEAFFYACFPVLAFGLLRLFRRSPPHTVLLCAAALWLVQLLVLWPQHAAVDDWRWYVFPPSRLAEFVVGMMLGIAYLRAGERARWPLRATSVEILALAAVVLAVYVSPLVPLAVRFSAWVMPAWCAVIFVFAHRRGAISRLLSHPALVRLGEISFAFYLCHIAVVMVCERFGWRHPLMLPLALGCTLALSFALYHGIEQPMRTRVRGLLMPRAARESLAAARQPLAAGHVAVAEG